MPMYHVTLTDPATPHTPFLIRAPLARVAQYTAISMFQASVPKAPGGTMPPLDPEGTIWVQGHDSVYPETGPRAMLEPAHH